MMRALPPAWARALLAAILLPMIASLLAIIVVTDNGFAWAAIHSSGDTAEMFLMPVIVLVPATLSATLGGVAALLGLRCRA